MDAKLESAKRAMLRAGDGRRDVWAECLFADPISDIAVPWGLDNQELSDQADQYEALIDSHPLRAGSEILGGSGCPHEFCW